MLAHSASPCSDDIVGSKPLTATPSDLHSHLPVTFSTYDRDDMILDELATFYQHHFPGSNNLFGDTTPDLPALHTSHCAALLPTLDKLYVSREQLVRDPSAIFMDYEPWIRCMSRVDDMRLLAYNTSMHTADGTARRTRNSQRRIWEEARWIQLDEHERDILRRTAFNLDADTGGPTDPVPSL